MPSRKLLITGATGLQGGAVIDALLAISWPGEIFALTRNAKSPKAKALALKRNVTVVQGNPSSPAAIFSTNKSIDGVFLLTAFSYGIGKEDREDVQGVPMITEAVKAGVKHLIFASVDRGATD